MPIFDPAGYLVVLLMRVYTGGALVQVHELALGYVYELGLVLWHERRRSWALEHTRAARDQRFGS